MKRESVVKPDEIEAIVEQVCDTCSNVYEAALKASDYTRIQAARNLNVRFEELYNNGFNAGYRHAVEDLRKAGITHNGQPKVAKKGFFDES